ncbi:hypothetical protein QJS10_CPB11g01332 [Acorus calamus]|uniref:Uncharacterized protein n=1 Tax=Acorus calamus TaxID=4465 RepID=A0AAV9DTF6_ACOCL|nr:hypothetical protein QJS10_CPB11g01332 [Acorus calamus]
MEGRATTERRGAMLSLPRIGPQGLGMQGPGNMSEVSRHGTPHRGVHSAYILPPRITISDSPAPSVLLPTHFDTRAEVAWLSQSVITEARGWSPSPAQVKELLVSIWDDRLIDRVRAIGGDTFVVTGLNGGLKETLLHAGAVKGTEGSLIFSQWTPEFGTIPLPKCRNVRLIGVPLHWLTAGCIQLILAKFGEVSEFLFEGRDQLGRTVKEVRMRSPAETKFPSTLVVTYGREQFRVDIQVAEGSTQHTVDPPQIGDAPLAVQARGTDHRACREEQRLSSHAGAGNNCGRDNSTYSHDRKVR